MRTLDLQEFVDEIYADLKKNEDTEYIFFLGAGCSKSSGIPLASELAEQWYEELKEQTPKFDKFNKNHKIEKSTKIDFAKLYFEIFEELFPTPIMQQQEIQRITNDDKVNPSLGYYVLASLMQERPFNTIVTTNFDNLIQDALIYSGNKRALVITHQDLAQFIKRNNTPLVVKVHGDAHMHPFNNKKETKKIPDELKGAIKDLFTNAKVICIGYGGNDESIADLLAGCERIDQVYWLNTTNPKDVKLSSWWKSLSGNRAYIHEYDFDKIMNVIKSKFNIKQPDFQKLAQKLEDSYNCALQEEIEDIKKIEDKDKTSLDYFLLGNTYYEQEEYEKAIEAYKKAIEINPKDDSAYINMGNAYQKQEEYEKAIEAYKKVIEISPKNDSTYTNMGSAYADQEEYEKAIEAYKKAIEINPKNDSAYFNMGIVYQKQEEYEKAIKVYKKVIEINPKNSSAYTNKGFVYYKQDKYDKAIELYKKAMELNPKEHIAYVNLFEAQLVQDSLFDIELEKKYIQLFGKEKDKFIKYDMLQIFAAINENKEVDLDKWLSEYKEYDLVNWSFEEMERWVETKKGAKKEKLLKAIEVFKSKVPR